MNSKARGPQRHQQSFKFWWIWNWKHSYASMHRTLHPSLLVFTAIKIYIQANSTNLNKTRRKTRKKKTTDLIKFPPISALREQRALIHVQSRSKQRFRHEYSANRSKTESSMSLLKAMQCFLNLKHNVFLFLSSQHTTNSKERRAGRRKVAIPVIEAEL